MIRIQAGNFTNTNKDLDDICSPALSSISVFIMQQPTRDELILEIEKDETTEQEILNAFSGLGMNAQIVERGFVYEYQYGLPNFHTKIVKDH